MDSTASAPSVADGVEHSLDPRSISVARIGGWIFFGALALAQLVALIFPLFLSDLPFWVKAATLGAGWPLVTAGLIWLAHWWPVVAYRHASYRVDGQGIEIKRGVIWRTVISVPRNRVQHTDVSQGPVERSFGLGTLVIFTAGTEHARVTLGGLDHAVALGIRDHLLASEAADAV